MAKEGGKARQKRRKASRTKTANGFELKPSSYQPTKAELEENISVPVSLERLAKAAVKGGALSVGLSL